MCRFTTTIKYFSDNPCPEPFEQKCWSVSVIVPGIVSSRRSIRARAGSSRYCNVCHCPVLGCTLFILLFSARHLPVYANPPHLARDPPGLAVSYPDHGFDGNPQYIDSPPAGRLGPSCRGGTPCSVPAAGALVDWLIKFTLTIERLWFAWHGYPRYSPSRCFYGHPFYHEPQCVWITFRGIGFPRPAGFYHGPGLPPSSPPWRAILPPPWTASAARGYEIERTKGGLIAQIRKVARSSSGHHEFDPDRRKMWSMPWICAALGLRPAHLRIQSLQYRWHDFCPLSAFAAFYCWLRRSCAQCHRHWRFLGALLESSRHKDLSLY